MANPLLDPTSGPASAPDYSLHRHVLANDVVANIPQSHGLNCEMYQYVNFQAVQRTSQAINGPVGGAGPVTVKVYEWSPGAGGWVDTGESFVASAAGVPIGKFFHARGRRILLVVSGLAGVESCSLYASGFALAQLQ